MIKKMLKSCPLLSNLRLKPKSLIVLIIVIIFFLAFAGAAGAYSLFKFHQANRLADEAQEWLEEGEYGEAMAAFKDSLSNWETNEAREGLGKAQDYQESAERYQEAVWAYQEGNWQECLDKLALVKTKIPEYDENMLPRCIEELALAETESKETSASKEEPAPPAAQPTQSSSFKAAEVSPSPSPTSAPSPEVSNSPPSTPEPEPEAKSSPENTPTETNESSCVSSPAPVFTHHLTDLSKVSLIDTPPNKVGGDLKTHSYLVTDLNKVPLYAPVDATLTGGVYLSHGSDPADYGLDFQVSCEVMFRIGHFTEPIESIRALFGSTPKDNSLTDSVTPTAFKAGDLLGYTTGTVNGNWDFGVYNSTKPNKYASDPNYSQSNIYSTAVCPFDYFESSLKSAYVAKYGSIGGTATDDGESFCK
jgi:hypothetical protein